MRGALLIAALLLFVLTVVRGASRAALLPQTLLDQDFYQEPWRPSSKIDEQGFLAGTYQRLAAPWEVGTLTYPVIIRQVPGDGNCLFHAIAVALYKSQRGRHLYYYMSRNDNDNDEFHELRQLAQTLRAQACRYLRRTKSLYLTGREYVATQVLLNRFRMTPEEYCDAMSGDGVWAGGPEIAALSNLLKRPICLYQLTVENKQFCVRPWCYFGFPRYHSQADAIHILSADARFPDMRPGWHNRKGNHFLAIFPQRRGC